MPERRRIAHEIETRVLSRSGRRCCLCFHLKRDLEEKLGQLAHLDHDPSNASEDNLAFLCMNHHSLYDSSTSQHKNHTIGEVKRARAKLYDELEQPKPCEWLLVLDGTFAELDRARVETIVEHLRKALGDPHLTIKKVEPGSINIFVESSKAAFEKIEELLATRELSQILGYPILTVKRIDKEFGDFWDANMRDLFLHVLQEVGIRTEAEDITALALERAWLTGELSRSRLFLEAEKEVRLSKRHPSPTTGQPSPDAIPASDLNPEQQILARERVERIRDILRALAPTDRAVVMLRTLHNYTYEEIADVLNVKPEVARVRYFRARTRLRDLLRKYQQEKES